MDDSPRLEEAVRRLERAMLPSGGFGYHPGGETFVEPTALALLAIAPGPAGTGFNTFAVSPVWERSLEGLLSFQHAKGSFGAIPGDVEPSWATSPALLALLAHGRREAAAAAGRWLVEWRAPEKPFDDEFREQMRTLLRIDAAICGWPWQVGEAFATVEPTALASIALRAWGGAGAGERIAEARRYFADRECPGGGWNYGTPYTYDKGLPPMGLATAKALLAVVLCGEPPTSPLARRGADALSRLLAENPSSKAHAWGALAFAAAGEKARAAEHAKAAADLGAASRAWGPTPDGTALALLAARAAEGQAPPCLSVQA